MSPRAGDVLLHSASLRATQLLQASYVCQCCCSRLIFCHVQNVGQNPQRKQDFKTVSEWASADVCRFWAGVHGAPGGRAGWRLHHDTNQASEVSATCSSSQPASGPGARIKPVNSPPQKLISISTLKLPSVLPVVCNWNMLNNGADDGFIDALNLLLCRWFCPLLLRPSTKH